MTDEVKITLSGRALDRLLREAREDEREACAEECDRAAKGACGGFIDGAFACAEAIRARSKE